MEWIFNQRKWTFEQSFQPLAAISRFAFFLWAYDKRLEIDSQSFVEKYYIFLSKVQNFFELFFLIFFASFMECALFFWGFFWKCFAILLRLLRSHFYSKLKIYNLFYLVTYILARKTEKNEDFKLWFLMERQMIEKVISTSIQIFKRFPIRPFLYISQ